MKMTQMNAKRVLASCLCLVLMTAQGGWAAPKKRQAGQKKISPMKSSASKSSAPAASSKAAAAPAIQWLDKWPDGSATGATYAVQGDQAVITGTASNRSYGNVYQNLSIDLEKAPYMTINIQSTDGFWYIIAKNSKIPGGYVRVQPDTNLTGKHIYDLRAVTGLSSKETIQMEIGISSGNPDPNDGKTMAFKDLRFTSQEVVIPGALRLSPWMDTWPDGSPTGASIRASASGAAVSGTSRMGYGSVRRVVSINLDKTPFLKISPVTVSAMWYLEATGGNLRAPVKIQGDTDATQPQVYNLKEMLGLAGDQSFELLVGVSTGGQDANAGKQFVFQDLSFVPTAQ